MLKVRQEAEILSLTLKTLCYLENLLLHLCKIYSLKEWQRLQSISSAANVRWIETKAIPFVDEKTLRELYLLPFQICIRKSNPWALMTAYNKLNGTYCSENNWLIQQLLRKEWRFTGMLMSDFEGTYTEVESVKAGLNLEMPGPSRLRADKLIKNLETGLISRAEIDKNVRYVVELASKVRMADESAPERAVESKSISATARQVAEEGIVLFKNDNATLPIRRDTEMKIAVFRAPATEPVIHGGGSSSLSPQYIITPLEGLRATYKNVEFRYGIPNFRKIPSAPINLMKTGAGAPGLDCFWYNWRNFGENELLHERLEKTRTLVIDPRIKGLESKHCTRMSYTLRPLTSGTHAFGITANGEARLYVDDKEILHHPGLKDTKVEYIMQPGRFERRANISMEGKRPYKIRIDTLSTVAPPPPPPAFQIARQATQVGFFGNLDSLDMTESEALASASDISIVFTGNIKEFESESFDRDQLGLSLGQDKLVSTIAAASKRTVVVNQTGSAISMPWLDSVDAVLQSWFAGMEVGNAIANIISGKVNPSGRLPSTFPICIEEVPSKKHFPADSNHDIRYAERESVGYRALKGSLVPKPLFVFGHGLSYSCFEYFDLCIKQKHAAEMLVEVSVTVRNVSKTSGKEVVQVYVDGVLKAFAKTHIKAGEVETVTILLDKYATSEWDTEAASKFGGKGAWKFKQDRIR